MADPAVAGGGAVWPPPGRPAGARRGVAGVRGGRDRRAGGRGPGVRDHPERRTVRRQQHLDPGELTPMPSTRALRPDHQRGSVTLELVVVFPLLMLLVWIGMQLVLVFFANRVALSAAQEGARAARQRTGSVATAERRTQRYLDQLGSTLLL